MVGKKETEEEHGQGPDAALVHEDEEAVPEGVPPPSYSPFESVPEPETDVVEKVSGARYLTIAKVRSKQGTPQGGVISPLLSNIFLHAFDRAFMEKGIGTLVRYADDWVVLCRSEREAKEALHVAGEILAYLGLGLHPEKTRIVDLREGREGFDFLGCHFRARVSGRMLERGVRRYYLQRWPSQRSMKRVRGKIKARTGRGRAGRDIREVIADINPILRGWGNYFRTGNAAQKFIQIDYYVVGRLRGLLVKRYGRNLRPGQTAAWTREWFETQGLYRLRGTVRYPGYAS